VGRRIRQRSHFGFPATSVNAERIRQEFIERSLRDSVCLRSKIVRVDRSQSGWSCIKTGHPERCVSTDGVLNLFQCGQLHLIENIEQRESHQFQQ
jgi:hypothetical protein